MINALHLLWIIPVAGSIGFMLAALLAAANGENHEASDAERPNQGQNGLARLLYGQECPVGYKCLAMDCMECLEMHADMEGESNARE